MNNQTILPNDDNNPQLLDQGGFSNEIYVNDETLQLIDQITFTDQEKIPELIKILDINHESFRKFISEMGLEEDDYAAEILASLELQASPSYSFIPTGEEARIIQQLSQSQYGRLINFGIIFTSRTTLILDSLLSYLDIQKPGECPPFNGLRWDGNVRTLLDDMKQNAQNAHDWEQFAYIRFQEGLYLMLDQYHSHANDAFLEVQKKALLGHNKWLSCLATFAQGYVNFSIKQKTQATVLFAATKRNLKQLRKKLAERGFYPQENNYFNYLEKLEYELQFVLEQLNHVKVVNTRRLLHSTTPIPFDINKFPQERSEQTSLVQRQKPVPLTLRPLINPSPWCDLYYVINSPHDHHSIPEITNGDWLLVDSTRISQRNDQIMVGNCETSTLPSPKVQVGLTWPDSQEIINTHYLLESDNSENQTLRLNNQIIIPRSVIQEYGTVIGYFHPIKPLFVPKDSSEFSLPQRVRNYGWSKVQRQIDFLLNRFRRRNLPPQLFHGQCEDPSPLYFECEPPAHLYCVQDRFNNQSIREIQPRDILITEKDTSKPIPPGSLIIVEDFERKLSNCIYAQEFRESLKAYTVGLFCEETKSGTIEYLVNNGERRRSSKEKTFRGNITCLFRWIG